MAVVWETLGSLLILAGLVDVFLTVLHYDEPGLIAARSYRRLWHAIRSATKPLPHRSRSFVRSMGAPFMVVATLGGWLGAEMLGFALVYLPAVGDRQAFAFADLPKTFWGALYFSAASLTSLSFSDAEPRSLGYHWLAAAETLAGLGILTLAISYLLGLYRVLQDQGELASRLQHQSRGVNDPRSLLEPHFVHGQPQALSSLLRDLHENLIHQHEGMRRYPIAYYFHAREPGRSMPYIFWVVGASAAALRWGLPTGHPAAEDPLLPALLDGFDDLRQRLTERFLPQQIDGEWRPVDPEAFASASRGHHSGDERLDSFLDVQRFMVRVAGVDEAEDADDAYRRYVEWGSYTSKGKAFVEAASRDLGLDPADMYRDPTQRRF